ncbi:MAG: methyltransferase domain-containing protein [Rikenellaceae bacterium]
MKGIIRWILGHLPRPMMQRMAEIVVPIMGLLYIGRGKECPICGTRRRRFLPYGYYATLRENALCPSCLSLERHRLLWLYLSRETDLLTSHPTLLHVAPEVCIMRPLRKSYKGVKSRYKTADLESPLADIHFDVQQIPLDDNSFEVILCNHILEHIPDDRLAMRELHRVLKPGGWGVLLSPVERDRELTFEDDSITDPEERAKIFGQYDHRRIYGQDYTARLAEAGFEVEAIDYILNFTPEQRRLYSISNEMIFLVRKV